jgi:sulfite reductase (ferredoxin)
MFQLPNEVKEDINNYKISLNEAQTERISSARFKGIRVPWGVYSHRGSEVFMTRIRIPAAIVTASQLKALASAALKYGDSILHITTRQDIQIHNVKIEDTVRVMEFLKKYNLSPRGGGGNTVRNVIACSLSGVCIEEVFDVRGDAIALTEHLMRQETSFNLPRKLKIAFSGCQQDCTGCLINDLGFFAKLQNGKKGYKVFVGGGMGANSRIGKLLEEFIPQEDLGYCVSSVKNVFFKAGDRRNKHHNRLRFLIEDIGLEEFKKLYNKEFIQLKNEESIILRKIDFIEEDRMNIVIPQVEDEQYKEFLKYNVQPQKQKGYSVAELRIPRGDISAKQIEALANIEKEFSGIQFRTSQNQNLLISKIDNQNLYRLFIKLDEILDDFIYPQTLLDVVACKGASTCNLGLCNSPGLAKEIEEVVREEFVRTPVFKKLDIKLNGCPNACGHQPVGSLSFYGMVRRKDKRPVPFYKFLLGGRKEAELTRLAEAIGIIPAKNIPNFLRDFIKRINKELNGKKDIYQVLDKPGRDIANEVLEKYSSVPAYSENEDYYMDWGKKEEFSLSGLGPGECGAGVLDMIEADLADAKLALEVAKNEDLLPQKIKQSLFFSARALLIVRGKDPKNEEQAFSDFSEKFIDTGIVPNVYSDVNDVYKSLRDDLSIQERKKRFNYTQQFLEEINNLYKSMDPAFNFPKIEKRITQETSNIMDLKGTPCPLNYVKVKLELEKLDSGDTLVVLLDEGEPIVNVPKSLKEDGHHILKIEKQDDFYKIIVKKK